MVILGKTSDEKGQQLELLAGELLSALGYSNVERNHISSGGEEIDVRAQYEVPSLGGMQRAALICECKAGRSPLAMTDWLKFLGKVLAEDTRAGQQTRACLVALAGVNGNVAGHHAELARRRGNVELVTGEGLLATIRRIFSVCDQATVEQLVGDRTTRETRSVELLYYDRAVYWGIILAGDVVTIVGHDGNLPDDAVLERMRPLVLAALPVREFIDLRQEAEALRRALLSEKCLLANIILGRGTTESASVLAAGEFSADEINTATMTLTERRWIHSDEGGLLCFTDKSPAEIYETRHDIDRFLLGGPMRLDVLRAFWSDYHTAWLDESYVGLIQQLQGELALTSDQVAEVRRVIAWSPTALAWALHPDPMLVGALEQGARDWKGNERTRLDRTRERRFFQMLYEHLTADFRRVPLREHFHDALGLREIQRKYTVLVKSRTGVELQHDLDERLALGQLADEYIGPEGSPYVIMQVMDGAPEPWEKPGALGTRSGGEDESGVNPSAEAT